jgi:oxygen-independent coproporphyrinogen-3 oxidase
MESGLVLAADLIAKYDRSGPRYTSYPTADRFQADFGPDDYAAAAARSNIGGGPLSLYFHIPFCNTVCFYCACNKIVTKDRSKAAPYLARLYREIALQAELFDPERPVTQLHWGGGTPTFISHDEMAGLMRVTGEHFRLLDDDSGEYSIEIDPREADAGTIEHLRRLGFNRISLGVQDFDPKVQRAVNRMQSREQTVEVIDAIRGNGFHSLSLDLIYGLPHQTASSFGETLDQVVDLQPNRLSVFNYAHLPERFKPQRRINEADLPSAAEKLDILRMTGEKLAAAGYVYIGMDHFARPDDSLAIAQREGHLYRNFQGYSTQADCDMVAMGVTSIGQIGDTYSQNSRDIDAYYAAIDAGQLPIVRGIELTEDDRIRRAVINQLMCHFSLYFSAVDLVWRIRSRDYFATELAELQGMADDGLLEMDGQGIRVLPAGRLLIRNICMVFDAWLRAGNNQTRFSRVI